MKAQPIPTHLREYAWYAPHQAWLRDEGLPHHDPGDASPKRAKLEGANLEGASLRGADLRRANLGGAILRDTCLGGAVLVEADLRDANRKRGDMTTHALRTPCPIETVLTWCGRPIDQIVGGEHYVVGLQDHAKITCKDCRKVIAETLEALKGFER